MGKRKTKKNKTDASAKENTVLDANKPKNKTASAGGDFFSNTERMLGQDWKTAKSSFNQLKDGQINDARKTLWKGLADSSGGSKLKAAGKLGMYSVGASAILDFANPLGFGWGD